MDSQSIMRGLAEAYSKTVSEAMLNKRDELIRRVNYKGFEIKVFQNRGGYYYAKDDYGEPVHNPIMFKTEKEALDNQKKELDKAVRGESVEVSEAVLNKRDYEIKNGKIYISKANYKKIHKDYKSKDKKTGEPTMMAMGPKGTTLFPVVFTENVTEEIQLTEAVNTVDDLTKEVKKTFEKYFPDSFIRVSYSSSFSKSISIRFALGKDNSEFNNKIIENDPMYSLAFIWFDSKSVDEAGNIVGPMVLESSVGKGLAWNGPDGFNRIKVPFRKTTGDVDKIMKALNRYFGRLKDAVKANADSINAAVSFDANKKVR